MATRDRLYWHIVSSLPEGGRLHRQVNAARRHLLDVLDQEAPVELFEAPLSLYEDAQQDTVEALIRHAYAMGRLDTRRHELARFPDT